MAAIRQSRLKRPAIIIDASVAVAICSKEVGAPIAISEMAIYHGAKAAFYAPAVIVSEVLYALCRKAESGLMTPADYAKSVKDFETLLDSVTAAPLDEFSLMNRAETIRSGFTCRRVTDAIYIALAEQLAISAPTVLLTFDRELPSQAGRHAPSVSVRVL